MEAILNEVDNLTQEEKAAIQADLRKVSNKSMVKYQPYGALFALQVVSDKQDAIGNFLFNYGFIANPLENGNGLTCHFRSRARNGELYALNNDMLELRRELMERFQTVMVRVKGIVHKPKSRDSIYSFNAPRQGREDYDAEKTWMMQAKGGLAQSEATQS